MAGIMLKEPTTVNSANYRLLSAGKWNKPRKGKVKALVVHVTAGAQDLGMSGKDESAESTNSWARSSGVDASWHRIADTDGVISCLPSWYTAWQAKGYNSHTVGVEIANRDARWDNKPKDWVKWTIWFAALAYADYAIKYKVPLRRATKAELDKAIKNDGAPVGFIDHSRLSDNRIDPGKTFPWTQFFGYVKAIQKGATSPDKPVPPKPPEPTPVTEEIEMFLVQLKGQPDVWKSDGFRRIHVSATERDALKKVGVKQTVFDTQAQVAAFGPVVSASAAV